jgi:hypothetical protein
MAFSAKSRYKRAEMGIELRGSAGQIDQVTPGALGRLQDQLHNRPFHDFISFGRGFEVAVRTPLVAQEPEIDLYCLDAHTVQSLTVDSRNLFFKIVHCYSS